VVVDTELTIDQIKSRLQGQIASFAVPSRWRLQKDPLPTNPAGKPDKPAISAQARKELQQPPATEAV
jgi:acyl-CoA synthetase (AMP-forming)/AMP-acid ligase II